MTYLSYLRSLQFAISGTKQLTGVLQSPDLSNSLRSFSLLSEDTHPWAEETQLLGNIFQSVVWEALVIDKPPPGGTWGWSLVPGYINAYNMKLLYVFYNIFINWYELINILSSSYINSFFFKVRTGQYRWSVRSFAQTNKRTEKGWECLHML